MKKLCLLLALVTALVACDDDHDFPDLVIGSAGVPDGKVHMSVYAHSTGSATELSVYLHKHHQHGYGQYLELTGDDDLSAVSQDWVAEFTPNFLPSGTDPMMVYYVDTLETSQVGQQIDVAFMRDGVEVIPAAVTLLGDTDFSVTSDTAEVTMDSTISVDWVAQEGHAYGLKFEFSCTSSGGSKTGFSVRYPRYSDQQLTSPFDLDLAQFDAPPMGVSDCSVAVNLLSEVDQTALQTIDDEILYVEASRQQTQALPIVLMQ